MKTLPKRDDPTGIDLSPLIDMVFILLIFFMVTSTFVKDANVDLKRPSASSATSASTKSLRVTIDAQGKVYLDGLPTRVWALQAKVKDAFRRGKDKDVLVIADRRAKVDSLIEVVDLCRLAGANAVTVATEKEGGA